MGIYVRLVSCSLLPVVFACGSKKEPAPAPPREVAVEAQVSAAEKRAELAGERAASEVRKTSHEEADPARVEKRAAAAKARAAQRAMQKEGAADVAVVKWKSLARFVPAALGSYRALSEVEGRDREGEGPRLAAVRRVYESGTRRAKVQVTDALIAKVLHAPFAVSASINQETDNGFRRSIKLGDHPAILQWRAKEAISRLALLVGGRYVVDVHVSNAQSGDDALAVAERMDLPGLAALRAELGKTPKK